MAFSMDVTGMDELEKKLGQLGEKGRQIAALALYEGAGVVADQVSAAVRGIATEPFQYAAGGRTRKPSPEEKALLENAPRGVSKFKKSEVRVETNVGLRNAGYGSIAGKSKPIPMIANAINSGTSFMQRQPFFRKATSRSGAAAAAIENKLRAEIENLSVD